MEELEGPSAIAHHRIFSSMATGVAAMIIVSALGAVSVRVMTTGLGAAAFGIFVLVQSYVTLVQTFTDLGLAQVLVRDIARGGEDEHRLLSHALGLRLALSIGAVPVAVALGLLIYMHRTLDLREGLVVFAFSIPFAVSQEVSGSHFSAQLRNTILAVGSVMQQVIFVGLVIWSVESHRSVVFCLGAALAGSVVASLYTYAMARRDVRFTPSVDWRVWRSMLRTSTPIGFAYVVGLLYFKADTIILSLLSTAREIGYYGAAYAVVAFFLVISTTISRTFLPTMVRASRETLSEAVHNALAYFAIGGVFSATAVATCGPSVVSIVAGPHFEAANTPLRYLGLGLVFIFLSSGLSSVCVARGFGNKIFVMSVVSLVLNVALNLVLIPLLGIVGAALATLACEVISLVLFMGLVRREMALRVRVVGALVRPVLAGGVTCAVLAPLYTRAALSVGAEVALMGATLLVFLVALFALRGVPREATDYLRAVAGRARHRPS